MKNPTLWIVIGGIALFVLGLFGGMLLPFGSNYPVCGYGFANGYGLMGYRGFMPMMGGSRKFAHPCRSGAVTVRFSLTIAIAWRTR